MNAPIMQRFTLTALPLAALAVLGAIGSPGIAVGGPLPYGPDTCIQGYMARSQPE